MCRPIYFIYLRKLLNIGLREPRILKAIRKSGSLYFGRLYHWLYKGFFLYICFISSFFTIAFFFLSSLLFLLSFLLSSAVSFYIHFLSLLLYLFFFDFSNYILFTSSCHSYYLFPHSFPSLFFSL